MAQSKQPIVRVSELVKKVGTGIITETLQEVAPRFVGKSEAEIVSDLGLTPAQYGKLEHKILDKVAARLNAAMHETFVNETGVEFPGVASIGVHASKTRKDGEGKPVRKLAVKTRAQLKNTFNVPGPKKERPAHLNK